MLEISQESAPSRTERHHVHDIKHEDGSWFTRVKNPEEHDLNIKMPINNNELEETFIQLKLQTLIAINRPKKSA